MRKLRRSFTVLAIVTALVMLALPAATAGQPGSANGSGKLDPWRSFAFSAVERQDGTVTGEGQLSFAGGPYSIHFSIDCLNVSGNTATMSGRVTNVSGFPETGSDVWFQVKDNGEGKKADPDQMTYLPVEGLDDGAVPTCDADDYEREDEQTDLYQILTGNVQVRGG